MHEFKAHGIVLRNTHLFGDENAITAADFAATPEVAEVKLFVAVCGSEAVARDLARRPGSPLRGTATVKRRKNVVLYLAPDIAARSRRGALEALASLLRNEAAGAATDSIRSGHYLRSIIRNWFPDGSRRPASRPYGCSVGSWVNSTPRLLSSS